MHGGPGRRWADPGIPFPLLAANHISWSIPRGRVCVTLGANCAVTAFLLLNHANWFSGPSFQTRSISRAAEFI